MGTSFLKTRASSSTSGKSTMIRKFLQIISFREMAQFFLINDERAGKVGIFYDVITMTVLIRI